MQRHYESEEVRLLKENAVNAFNDTLRKKMEEFINKYQETVDEKIKEAEDHKHRYESDLKQIKTILSTLTDIHNSNNKITR